MTQPTDPYASVPEQADAMAEDEARRYEPPSGYLAPSGYSRYTPPASSTSAGLGWVALIAGMVALIGSAVTGAVIVATFTPDNVTNQVTGAAVLGLSMMFVLVLWFPFGIWAIVQGIVAIVQQRGRWQGVVALIIGVFGPWVGIMIAMVGITATFSSS